MDSREQSSTRLHVIPADDRATDAAWRLLLAAARYADDRLSTSDEGATFALDERDALKESPAGHPSTIVRWRPGVGWELTLPADDPRHALIDLYRPICSATLARPITIGHLGQSLDGFIATHSGDSQYVTGQENILHLHRLRALCDAVVVGAGTIAADNPQLTTRHVAGPNPLRVIFDPTRRLAGHYRVFSDDSAETLYVCDRSLRRQGETQMGRASLVTVDGPDPAELLRVLHDRGCRRIFVEGGGVTVSTFLEAGLLDRLHIAIAPLIIGSGRPAIRLPACEALRDCRRPRYRVFRMGGDVLFDCDLRAPATDRGDDNPDAGPPLARII